MALSQRHRKDRDELFPGHVSTLKVSDPELIEYFDKSTGQRVVLVVGATGNVGRPRR